MAPREAPRLDAIADGQPLDGLTAPVVEALHERAAVAEARLRARLLALGYKASRPPAHAEDAEEYLTAEDIAARTGLSRGHVYELARSGKLPSQRFGRAVRFPRSAFNRQIP